MQRIRQALIACLFVLSAAVLCVPALADLGMANTQDQDAAAQDSQTQAAQDDPRAALEAIQNMVIGEWRGVGQPRRGSSRGSWIETATWSWEFQGDQASLVFSIEDGKFYSSGEIKSGDEPNTFVFTGTTADGEKESFSGKRDEDGKLSFMAAEEAKNGRPARISFRTVANGDRLLILLERQLAEDRFSRLAEIGYTRQGSGFGQGASTGPECVVTGGLGTIPVEHDGKTYYVCCTGCQGLFDEDPERILAEYAKRKEAEKNKKNQ